MSSIILDNGFPQQQNAYHIGIFIVTNREFNFFQFEHFLTAGMSNDLSEMLLN